MHCIYWFIDCLNTVCLRCNTNSNRTTQSQYQNDLCESRQEQGLLQAFPNKVKKTLILSTSDTAVEEKERRITTQESVSSRRQRTSTTRQSTEWSSESRTPTSSRRSSTPRFRVTLCFALLTHMNCQSTGLRADLPTGLLRTLPGFCFHVVFLPSLDWMTSTLAPKKSTASSSKSKQTKKVRK